jgi:hypothetical protein
MATKLTYIKPLEDIARKGYPHTKVLSAFMRLAACVLCGPDMRHRQWYQAVCAGVPSAYRMLQMPNREAQYLEEVSHWNREDLTLFAHAFGSMLIDAENNLYDDVLGRVYMEWSGNGVKQMGGEFYTPIELCYMISKLSVRDADFDKPEPITLNDCSCGSGNMMLGSIRVMHQDLKVPSTQCLWMLQDISSIACDMAFINCCLYGVPAVVIHGNSLSRTEWNRYYTPWYPVAHGNFEAQAEEIAEPQSVFEVTPERVMVKSSKTLERVLTGQNSLFMLEME